MEGDDVIHKAYAENWILITNDKDFGEKVYRERRPHRGVVLLRLEDERAVSKIDTLRRLLEDYSKQLANRFVVVTEKRVRFARAE
jgi:predicted nuclease of predicted toxin-antitoxin system